ncbi:hypothetical protein BDW75DRAFT_232820 [Aspergillus navahoensis]
MTPLVIGQSLPDCVDVSCSTGRLFWTNIGRATSAHDDSVHSAKLDVSDIQTLLHPGSDRKVYFCDREGMGVHRCNLDGSGHEVLVQAGNLDCAEHCSDLTRWCKGPSKAGRCRIFRAGLEIPAGQTAENRTDIQLLLDGLPEPIDLDLDVDSQRLYWTDGRGASSGCSLNRVDLSGSTRLEELKANKDIVARHFNEPIGLRVADGGAVYVGDLRKLCYGEGACYAGVALGTV